MALPTKLFFRRNEKYGVGSIEFDLLLSEEHNFDSIITDRKIQDGSIISDHIENELENGSLEGLITNYSLNTGIITTNRAQDVFDALIALWEKKTKMTIVTLLRTYNDVVISSMPFSKSDASESLNINISFRKLPIVKLQTVELELSIKLKDQKSNQNRQISSKKNLGRQTTTASAETLTG